MRRMRDIRGMRGTRGTRGKRGTWGTRGTRGTDITRGTRYTRGTRGTRAKRATRGTWGTRSTKSTRGTRGTRGMRGTRGSLADKDGPKNAMVNHSTSQCTKYALYRNVPIIWRNQNFIEYFSNWTTFPFPWNYICCSIQLTGAQNKGFRIKNVLLNYFG